jgi:hypothetical protein
MYPTKSEVLCVLEGVPPHFDQQFADTSVPLHQMQALLGVSDLIFWVQHTFFNLKELFCLEGFPICFQFPFICHDLSHWLWHLHTIDAFPWHTLAIAVSYMMHMYCCSLLDIRC